MSRFLLTVLSLILAGGLVRAADPALRLAYVKNEAKADNVYVAADDGTGVRQITRYQNDGNQRCAVDQLAWSPDGNRLAFLFAAVIDKVLVVADVAAGKTTDAVKSGFDSRVSAVTWVPGGRQLLYLAGGLFKRDLHLAAPDGSGARPLTKMEAPFQPVLAWAPNGKSLAVLIKTATTEAEGVTHYGPADVHLVDPVTGKSRVVAQSPGDDAAVAWAPDGRQLVVEHVPVAMREGNVTQMAPPELRLVTLAEGRTVTLSPAKAYEQEPAWAPDGSQIAFSSVRGGGSRSIYIMAPDGEGAKQLTEGNWGKEDRHPAWAPTGKKLAFLRKEDGIAYPRLIVMDPDGRNPVTVAEGVKAFAWAPHP